MELLYKRKSFKFANEQFSRYSRHAEALKARESSRFKRLSMVRSINLKDEDSTVDVSLEKDETPLSNKEAPKIKVEDVIPENLSVKKKVIEPAGKCEKKEVKKPSRLECLQKWKQEKLLKQELARQKAKPAFYGGANPVVPPFKATSLYKASSTKTSFLSQKNMSSNTSRMPGSRYLLPPTQTSKTPNASQMAPPGSKMQNSRVPYNFKAAAISYSQHLKEMNKSNSVTKRTVSSLPAPKAPGSKPTSLKKEAVPTIRKPIAQTSVPSSKSIVAPKSINSMNNTNSVEAKSLRSNYAATKSSSLTGAVPKVARTMNKSNLPTRNTPTAVEQKNLKGNTTGSKISYLGSSLSRSEVSRLPNKSAQKVSATNVLSKPATFKTPNNPVFKQVKASNGSNTLKMGSKPTTAAASNKTGAKKVQSEVPFKKPGKSCQKNSENLAIKPMKNKSDGIEETSVDATPEILFNCDVSVIAGSASFAPMNFQFQPPTILCSFFEDDPFEVMEMAKKKFLSRTSTPSKDSDIKPIRISSHRKSAISDKNNENQKPDKVLSVCEESAVEDNRKSEAHLFRDLFDDDPYEALENAKKKYMPRISTPTGGSDIKPIGKSSHRKSAISDKNNENQKPDKVLSVCEESAMKDNGKSEAHPLQDLFDDDKFEALEDAKKKYMPRMSPSKVLPQTKSEAEWENPKTIEICSEPNTINQKLEDIKLQVDIKDSNLDAIFDNESLMSESPGILVSDSHMFYDESKIVNEICSSKSLLKPCFADLNDFNTEEKFNGTVNNSYKETVTVNTPLISVHSDKADHDELSEDTGLLTRSCAKEIVKNDAIVSPFTDKNSKAVENLSESCASFQTNDTDKLSPMDKSTTVVDISEKNSSTTQNQTVNGDSMSSTIKYEISEQINMLPEKISSSEIKNIVDVEETLKLEEEKNKDSFEDRDFQNFTDKKPSGAVPKRVSMLRKMSVLNPIAESSETPSKSTKKVQPTRSSTRLSSSLPIKLENVTTIDESDKNDDSIVSKNPRRSPRLQNASMSCNDSVFEQVNDAKTPVPLRRSMRLINLNTPDRDFADCSGKTNITREFAKLCLSSENDDPNLVSVGSMSESSRGVGRRVSLLYSPKRRQSIRKSIKGDLISFSPGDN